VEIAQVLPLSIGARHFISAMLVFSAQDLKKDRLVSVLVIEANL
jgi:hypothetical protein